MSPATPNAPSVPAPVAAVHGPYEDLAIAGINFLKDLIDGMTPAQRVEVWQGWIDFWKSLGVGK